MIDREFVEKLRKEKKISKTEFPKLIGMSPTGYSQMWENKSFKLNTLEEMARVLEVPVTYFFDGKETVISEDTTPNYDADDARARLMACMEKQENLYERLLASEAEKAQLRRELQEALNKISGI